MNLREAKVSRCQWQGRSVFLYLWEWETNRPLSLCQVPPPSPPPPQPADVGYHFLFWVTPLAFRPCWFWGNFLLFVNVKHIHRPPLYMWGRGRDSVHLSSHSHLKSWIIYCLHQAKSTMEVISGRQWSWKGEESSPEYGWYTKTTFFSFCWFFFFWINSGVNRPRSLLLCCCCWSVPQLNTLRVTQYVHPHLFTAPQWGTADWN